MSVSVVVVVVVVLVLSVRHENTILNVIVDVCVLVLTLTLVIQVLVRVNVVSGRITIIHTIGRRSGRRHRTRIGKRMHVKTVHIAVVVCSYICVFLFREVVVGKLKVEHVQ
jgi:hypothetical protein